MRNKKRFNILNHEKFNSFLLCSISMVVVLPDPFQGMGLCKTPLDSIPLTRYGDPEEFCRDPTMKPRPKVWNRYHRCKK